LTSSAHVGVGPSSPEGGYQGADPTTQAAKVLAKIGQIVVVQLLLGHPEPDHEPPYLDGEARCSQAGIYGALMSRNSLFT